MGYLSCKIGSSIVESHRRSPPPPQIFLFKDLELATNGFSPSSLLGKGSHGCVYRAVLKNGSQVAVKRPSYGRRMLQDEAAFDNEIRVLSVLHNPRFVRLLGVCHDAEKEKLLVVELMHNGTLYDLLHENLEGREAIGWSKRVDIALQTAKAVLEIHSFTPPLIHRDIKSSNIFMDRHWNAKLGDFGLALYSNAVAIPPAGTLGYLDPEYTTPDMLSTKNDVFSFGILLLEIISGRNAIDVHYNPPSIVEWAVPLIKAGRTIDICDPKLQPPKNMSFLKHMAILAAKCVRDKSTRRPDMNHVVQQLQEISNSIGFSVFNGIAHRMMTQDCKSDAHHHTTCHKKGGQRNLRVYDESRSLFHTRGQKLKVSINTPSRHTGDSEISMPDDGGPGPSVSSTDRDIDRESFIELFRQPSE